MTFTEFPKQPWETKQLSLRLQNNRGKQNDFYGSFKTTVGNKTTLAEVTKRSAEQKYQNEHKIGDLRLMNIFHCQSEALEDPKN